LLAWGRVSHEKTTLSSERLLICIFVAVYIPPQTDAGTNTLLKELYTAISKQEIAHPEATLQVAGDLNAGKLHQLQRSSDVAGLALTSMHLLIEPVTDVCGR
jgi:hypothetical protein